MKLKAILPWLLVLGLAVALGAVYSSNQQQAADLAKFRQDSDELQKVRAAAEEAKGNQAQAETEELTRLRKEHDELLKLRNDIGQMRVEKDQLAKQAMAAKQPVVNPEEQQQLQQLVAENLRLKATAQQTQQTGQQRLNGKESRPRGAGGGTARRSCLPCEPSTSGHSSASSSRSPGRSSVARRP